jgi:hypothetical protein
MNVGGREYGREALLERIGSPDQLYRLRPVVLEEGAAKGLRAIDVDTGGGLSCTVLPDRGLDISQASYRGPNLVYLAPPGEVHPSYFESGGKGFVRTFFAGLLTTCGLTHFGPPCEDEGQKLGLHGRHSAIPARQVSHSATWEGNRCLLRISGVVEDAVLFGDKIRLTRTLSFRAGGRSIFLRDTAENFGYRPCPFTILYHVNAGFPLLDAGGELALSSKRTEPRDEAARKGFDAHRLFGDPIPTFQEEVYMHFMRADREGYARAALVNRSLAGGLALALRFRTRELPYMTEWKMMGQGEYVLGMEPCNAPCKSRADLRKDNALPMLAPGEMKEMSLEISVLEGPAEIDEFLRLVETTA